MVRSIPVVAAIATMISVFATSPLLAAAQETCAMEKIMLGFQSEPSKITVGATGASMEVYHTYQSPSTMKTKEYLTCRLHLECTIGASASSFVLPVEETDFGVGSIKRKRQIVRDSAFVDFQDSNGKRVQKCRISRITDK